MISGETKVCSRAENIKIMIFIRIEVSDFSDDSKDLK